jgi:hypothetical protein
VAMSAQLELRPVLVALALLASGTTLHLIGQRFSGTHTPQ